MASQGRLFKRGDTYWCDLRTGGHRIRKSLRTRMHDEAERKLAELKVGASPAPRLVRRGKPYNPMEWVRAALRSAKNRAAREGCPFALSIQHLLQLLTDSGGRCALTGIRFRGEERSSRRPFVPSIDRVDPAAGYVLGNVRIVCVCVNFAMSDWGASVFHEMSLAYAASVLTATARTTGE